MKISITFLTALLYTMTIFFSCKKERISTSLDPFYHMTVNNELKRIAACGTSAHVAEYLKDTAFLQLLDVADKGLVFILKEKFQTELMF